VAHGDGVGSGDLKYRALKWTIRNRLFTGAFRVIHPDVGTRIAMLASTTEHKAEGGDVRGKNRAAFIQRWAEGELRARPEIDLVLAGHAHVASITEVERGRYYVNSGDWLRTYDYVVLPPRGGPPELRTWPAE
jgi:UDP-2,3-diacylglucosamine hydrolase